MRDYAIGLLTASALWWVVIQGVTKHYAGRIERLSMYVGSLEQKLQRVGVARDERYAAPTRGAR